VKNQEFDDKMIDLQLPDQDLQYVETNVPQEQQISEVKIEFKEKTLDSVSGLSKGFNDKAIFKKRKIHFEHKRNLRTKQDD
jgi:hypothetical protein